HRLYLAGHSSGAHLIATALAESRRSRAVPADAVRGATLVSGPYDMEPVVLSARGSYVKLTPEEVLAMSPVRDASAVPCPVIVAWASGDTDEFRRQSRAYAAALRAAGHLEAELEVPGINHFEIMESLGDPDALLVRRMLQHVGTACAGSDAPQL
ncbi:MAG: alpha/beta hydrolase, partial [Acetobacteraceae bacterium]|nr:alpha/beta hydrolase [Acetobacteraceae bacterium]